MRTGFLLLCLSAAVALGQEPAAEVIFNRAIQAQQRGDYPAAIQDYEKVLKLQPGKLEARANLAVALAHEGHYDAAIAQYRQVLAAAPHDSALHMNLGIAYYKKGDFANARRQFAEVERAQGTDARLAILLGDSEVKLGQAAEAVALMTPLEAENAGNSDFEYVLGSALVHAGHQREGAERLEKVAASTQSADAWMLAGSTLMDLNDFARAQADLDTAVRLNPNLPGVETLDGMAKDMNGNAADAEPVLREAVKRNPADFNANLYLGAILYKRRAMEEAKTYLDRALKIQPSSPTAIYEMALWESTSGDYANAAGNLERLEKSSPDWLQPHVELATLYYRLHRPADGARERDIVTKLKAEQQSAGPPKIQQP